MAGKKCEVGCTCRRHQNGISRGGRKQCQKDCQCKRHQRRVRQSHTESSKEKIRAKRALQAVSHSEETRRKIGEANRGRKRSQEFRDACRERRLGSGRGWFIDGNYRVLTSQFGHPLAGSSGVVRENRKVLYDKIGPGPHSCYWGCGRTLEWGGIHGIQSDHVDGDTLNNDPENLVPSCLLCNRIGMRLGTKVLR